MARWRGTTTERGYGHAHTTERQRRLAAYKPGDRCAHGGEPLNYPPPKRVTDKYGTRLTSPWLDLPHTTDRTGYLPGLACRRHNRADGARRKNRKHGDDPRRARPGPAKPAQSEAHRCQYCGNLACILPICQVAARQASRMAQAEGLPISDAVAVMAAKVQRPRTARTW